MFFPFEQLQIPHGILSVIGSGGKTSFLRYLSEALSGTVLLTTSTHMFPFAGIPLLDTAGISSPSDIQNRLSDLFLKNRIVCAGSLSQQSGKLSAPDIHPGALLPLADYILTEADGSRGFPLKAHRSFEPVIWAQTALTIGIVGASAIGRPVQEVCHCPERFCSLAETSPETPVSPGQIARVLNREDLADLYFVNQVDCLPDPEPVFSLCEQIQKPASAGSLQKHWFL